MIHEIGIRTKGEFDNVKFQLLGSNIAIGSSMVILMARAV
jgi:hypothetical protein